LRRGVLHVRRQIQAVNGRLYFALPKGAKTRIVNMPSSVAEELKGHVEAFPPLEVELPWGKPEADGQRRRWKDGFPVLRHTYASIMPEAGESVVTPARWLGHSSPAVTLGYNAHFMPEAGSKGRAALDGLLGRRGDERASRNSPDSPLR
jgi:integrase